MKLVKPFQALLIPSTIPLIRLEPISFTCSQRLLKNPPLSSQFALRTALARPRAAAAAVMGNRRGIAAAPPRLPGPPPPNAALEPPPPAKVDTRPSRAAPRLASKPEE